MSWINRTTVLAFYRNIFAFKRPLHISSDKKWPSVILNKRIGFLSLGLVRCKSQKGMGELQQDRLYRYFLHVFQLEQMWQLCYWLWTLFARTYTDHYVHRCYFISVSHRAQWFVFLLPLTRYTDHPNRCLLVPLCASGIVGNVYKRNPSSSVFLLCRHSL